MTDHPAMTCDEHENPAAVSGILDWDLYDSETWTVRKLERKCLESFKMWYRRRMEKIKWSEKITIEEVVELT